MARPSVTLGSETAQWGGTLDVKATSGAAYPWLRAFAWQNRVHVYGQYIEGTSGTFRIGPTIAADESQIGEGQVDIGYFGKNGLFRVQASAKFGIVPG